MYICVEQFTSEGGTDYSKGDLIHRDAYSYLQPKERENFEPYAGNR